MHTSNFGVKLHEHMRASGVECELVYPGAPNVKHKTTEEYLISRLLSNDEWGGETQHAIGDRAQR